jgi:NAD(P)-dependent dehydrogenase (short-subunit alcohol dehydrogenase family)
MGRVDGKVALVTGSGNGQGKAEAKMLAREGAKVVVADIRSADAEAVSAEINESGGDAIAIALDVTSPESWKAALDETEAKLGKLNILVNNAGISSSSQADPMGIEGYDRILAVNAKGTFLGCREAIPRMIENGGGAIVNISSTSGIIGMGLHGHPGYNVSKGGVRLLTKALAARHATQGIRCNSVHPGTMPPMTSAQDKRRDADSPSMQGIPMGRMGEVDEVAYAVLFMASDEASYITGAELVVDGGMTCV